MELYKNNNNCNFIIFNYRYEQLVKYYPDIEEYKLYYA